MRTNYLVFVFSLLIVVQEGKSKTQKGPVPKSSRLQSPPQGKAVFKMVPQQKFRNNLGPPPPSPGQRSPQGQCLEKCDYPSETCAKQAKCNGPSCYFCADTSYFAETKSLVLPQQQKAKKGPTAEHFARLVAFKTAQAIAAIDPTAIANEIIKKSKKAKPKPRRFNMGRRGHMPYHMYAGGMPMGNSMGMPMGSMMGMGGAFGGMMGGGMLGGMMRGGLGNLMTMDMLGLDMPFF